MSEEPAGHTCPEGGEKEGHHFGAPGIHGHGVGRQFAVTYRVERLSNGRSNEIIDDPDTGDGPNEHRGQIRPVRLIAQPPWPADELQVLEETLYDKQKCQGNDRQVVATGSK